MRNLLALVALVAFVAVLAFAILSRGPGRHGAVVRASWTLTPGALNPDVTQQTIRSTICVSGWTRTVRPPVSYTNHLKEVGLRQYGLTGQLSAYQEDHLISLELGGSPNDPRNLWPEPYPRAARVDQMENALNREVCAGTLTLADAQRKESALKHADG